MSDNDKKHQKQLDDLRKAKELHDAWPWKEQDWGSKNWRAWGSWFSWGSPIGLALFYAIVLLSTGGFIWIVNNV